jgi:GT2 family glycosyltransferase
MGWNESTNGVNMIRIDLVTVYHNNTNIKQHVELGVALRKHERDGYRFIGVDNRVKNRGFAAGCNLGAFHPEADAAVIGFLNPDVSVRGPFVDKVLAQLTGTTVITGCRFAKPKRELDIWGVQDWVCGATFFVRRDWFERVGGFDEQFVWSWEETDLIRTAETMGFTCRSILLPLKHDSPTADSIQDSQYKKYHFEQGQKRYLRKWERHRF